MGPICTGKEGKYIIFYVTLQSELKLLYLHMDVVVMMSVLSRFFSIIKEIKSHAFEIESVDKDDSTGLLFFWVKVGGKCTPPLRKDPISLLKEGSKYFSKEDFDWIIDTVLENQKRIIEQKYKKKHSLIKHQFSEQLEEALIVYSDLRNKIYIKPASEIYSDIEKLKKFSSEDSACIGNIVGCCEAEKGHRLREERKANNVIKFDISRLSGQSK